MEDVQAELFDAQYEDSETAADTRSRQYPHQRDKEHYNYRSSGNSRDKWTNDVQV